MIYTRSRNKPTLCIIPEPLKGTDIDPEVIIGAANWIFCGSGGADTEKTPVLGVKLSDFSSEKVVKNLTEF